MEIATVKDWVIVIWGILGIASIIMITSLVVILYLKIKPIVSNAKETTKNIRQTSTTISENIIKPISRVREFCGGACKVAGVIIKR